MGGLVDEVVVERGTWERFCIIIKLWMDGWEQGVIGVRYSS